MCIRDRFLKDKRKLVLSDIRDNYCAFLKARFESEESLEEIIKLDLVHPEFDQKYANLLGTFDGLFALNVVEHIKDDVLAIANAKKLLRTGGRLVILVPAYQALYNSLDKALEHYRRYNKTSLSVLFETNDLKIERKYHFNFMGIFGWFVSGKLQKNETLPTGQMKLFNSLVPASKIIDKITLNSIGLSVVVEGLKV